MAALTRVSSAVGSSPMAGTLWVDRHLHKNGGSTLREVMLRNEEAGNCLYYGYAITGEGFRALASACDALVDLLCDGVSA